MEFQDVNWLLVLKSIYLMDLDYVSVRSLLAFSNERVFGLWVGSEQFLEPYLGERSKEKSRRSSVMILGKTDGSAG